MPSFDVQHLTDFDKMRYYWANMQTFAAHYSTRGNWPKLFTALIRVIFQINTHFTGVTNSPGSWVVGTKSWVVGRWWKVGCPPSSRLGFEGQSFLVSKIKWVKSWDNWNNTTPPVLHQKWNSETSNNDINNDEIYYPKVTSTSKITTQLHLRINTRALSGYLVWSLLIACVACVRKGRGRELGRETARGRKEEGNACKKAIVFAIPPTDWKKKITKITQLWMTSCQISLAAMYVFWSYFSHCFSFVFLKQEI